MAAKRSLNAPFVSDRIFVRPALRTAASMRPVADEVEIKTGRTVQNTL
jgi:hypothetical protein